jgi:hypothetical protein
MKKNIQFLFLVIVSILVSGCGSNTKTDPIEPEAPVAVQPYSFFNANSPIIITKPREVNSSISGNDFNLSVQLLKYGLVEIGAAIQMKPFDFKYGTIESSIVETDENGVATFHYLSPTRNEYDKVRGEEIILEAIFLLPDSITETNTEEIDSPPTVVLSQHFLLQFR